MKRLLSGLKKWAIHDALKHLIAKHKLKITDLLMDSGWENILLDQVDPNINLYYCDATNPWQKGVVERTIRGLRTYHLLALLLILVLIKIDLGDKN